MDVDHTTGVVTNRVCLQHPHKTGQNDQARIKLVNRVNQLLFKIPPGGEFPVVYHGRGNGTLPGPIQASGSSIVADNRHDFVSTGSLGIKQSAKI